MHKKQCVPVGDGKHNENAVCWWWSMLPPVSHLVYTVEETGAYLSVVRGYKRNNVQVWVG